MDQVLYTWVALGLYAAVTAALAYRGWRRTCSMEGFIVGNRDIHPVFVGLSLAAQLTSVATFIINPGLVYTYGLSSLLGLGCAAALGITVGVVIISKGFRRVGEQISAITVPGWLGSRYRSRGLQIVFSLLSLALISFMVLIVVALAAVLAKILQVPAWAAMAGIIIFVFTYVLLGGINTSAYTNSVQAVIMVIVALILIGSGLPLLRDGLGPFFAKLAALDPNLARITNPQSLYFRNLFEVFICNFFVGIALVCQPHVVIKAMSLKSSADLNRYLLTAIGAGMIFLLVMVTGLYARMTLLPGLRIDSVIPTYIATQFTGGIGVLIAVGVLCAGISTLEGLLLALSAILATDLFHPMLRAGWFAAAGEEEQKRMALRLARISLVGLGALTFGLAMYQMKNPTGGSVAIFAQYGIYGLFSASFAPMIFGIFYKGPLPHWAPHLAVAAALVVYLGVSLAEIGTMYNNPAVLSTFSIMASTLTMGISAILGRIPRKMDQSVFHPGPARR